MKRTRVSRGTLWVFGFNLFIYSLPATGQVAEAKDTDPKVRDSAGDAGRNPADSAMYQWTGQGTGVVVCGEVRLEGGTSVPAPVLLELVCVPGGVQRQGYTDSRGKFRFEIGNRGTAMDASQSGPTTGLDPLGDRRRTDVSTCGVRGILAGFRSDPVPINRDQTIIVLHKLDNASSFTFSATSAYAPKSARALLEKGQKLTVKKKWAEAERDLLSAVAEYPPYAEAWHQLGVVRAEQGKRDEAKQALVRALEADASFLSPYILLARMAAAGKNWSEMAKYAGAALKLNPFLPAEIYYISGVGHLNLNALDVAEEHTREGLRIDSQKNQIPRLHWLLSVILAERGDFFEAAAEMRAYLKSAPSGPETQQAEQQLKELQQKAASKH